MRPLLQKLELESSAAIALTIGTAILFSIPQEINPAILASHVLEFDLGATRYQSVFFALVALGSLAAMLRRSRQLERCAPHTPRSTSSALVTAFFAVAILRGNPMLGSWFVFATLRRTLSQRNQVPLMWIKWMLLCIVTVLTALFIKESFITPLIQGNSQQINLDSSAGMSSHYSMTLLTGIGEPSLSSVIQTKHSHYGIFMPLLAWLASVSWSSATGRILNPVDLVAALQVITIFVIYFTFRSINKRGAAIATLSVVLATPKLTFLSLTAPNTLGVRYLPILLAVLLVTMLIRRAAVKPWFTSLLGTILGLLATLAPEFSVVFLGFSMGIIAASSGFPQMSGRLFVSVGLLFASAIAVGIALTTVRELALGPTSQRPIEFLQLFSSGYGGLPIRWIPAAAIIFMLALTPIKRMIVDQSRFKPQPLQVGLGLAILSWLPYFMNRMDERNNLWLLVLLGALLLYSEWSTFGSSTVSSRLPNTLFLSLFAALLLSNVGGQISSRPVQREANCRVVEELVSAACLSTSDEQMIQHKFQTLRDNFEPRSVIVMSIFPAETYLSGYNRGTPYTDFFSEVATVSQQERVTEWIRAHSPGMILVDSIDNTRTRHFRTLISGVGGFIEQRNVEHHWIVYLNSGTTLND